MLPNRKWRETKQQPSRARSGHQTSCYLVSLHFLCDILSGHPVFPATIFHISYCSHNDLHLCKNSSGVGKSERDDDKRPDGSRNFNFNSNFGIRFRQPSTLPACLPQIEYWKRGLSRLCLPPPPSKASYTPTNATFITVSARTLHQ